MPADAIPLISFRSSDLPASQVRDHVRERFASSGNYQLILPEAPFAPGAIEHHGYMFGGMVMMTRKNVAHSLVRDERLIRLSQVDHYTLNLPLTQEAPSRYTMAEGRSVEFRPGVPLFADLANPLRFDFAAGSDLSLFIPRDALDALLPRKVDIRGVVPGGVAGLLLGDHLRTLAANAASMSLPEALAITKATLHLIAASIAPMAESLALARADFDQLLVRRIGRFIDTRLADPDLSAQHICAEFRMSRSTLYRLLEPVGGVATFIKERRLARIHAALAKSDQRIYLGRLADDFGFKSASQFSRAFRNQYGYSPKAARSVASSPQESKGLAPVDNGFADWLHAMRL